MPIVAAAIAGAQIASQFLPSIMGGGSGQAKLADTALVEELNRYATLIFDWARFTLNGVPNPPDSLSFRFGFMQSELDKVLAPNQACALIPQVQQANQKTLNAYVRPESKSNFTHTTMIPVLLRNLEKICAGQAPAPVSSSHYASVAGASAPVSSAQYTSVAGAPAPALAGGLGTAIASVGLTPVSGFVLLLGLGLAGTMGIIALSNK